MELKRFQLPPFDLLELRRRESRCGSHIRSRDSRQEQKCDSRNYDRITSSQWTRNCNKAAHLILDLTRGQEPWVIRGFKTGKEAAPADVRGFPPFFTDVRGFPPLSTDSQGRDLSLIPPGSDGLVRKQCSAYKTTCFRIINTLNMIGTDLGQHSRLEKHASALTIIHSTQASSCLGIQVLDLSVQLGTTPQTF